VSAGVTVTNTGKLPGDEVVQLYLKFPPSRARLASLCADFGASTSIRARASSFNST